MKNFIPVLLVSSLLVACGGGGGGSSAPVSAPAPTPIAPPVSSSSVSVSSETSVSSVESGVSSVSSSSVVSSVVSSSVSSVSSISSSSVASSVSSVSSQSSVSVSLPSSSASSVSSKSSVSSASSVSSSSASSEKIALLKSNRKTIDGLLKNQTFHVAEADKNEPVILVQDVTIEDEFVEPEWDVSEVFGDLARQDEVRTVPNNQGIMDLNGQYPVAFWNTKDDYGVVLNSTMNEGFMTPEGTQRVIWKYQWTEAADVWSNRNNVLVFEFDYAVFHSEAIVTTVQPKHQATGRFTMRFNLLADLSPVDPPRKFFIELVLFDSHNFSEGIVRHFKNNHVGVSMRPNVGCYGNPAASVTETPWSFPSVGTEMDLYKVKGYISDVQIRSLTNCINDILHNEYDTVLQEAELANYWVPYGEEYAVRLESVEIKTEIRAKNEGEHASIGVRWTDFQLYKETR